MAEETTTQGGNSAAPASHPDNNGSQSQPAPRTHTPPGADQAPQRDYEAEIERYKQQVSGNKRVIDTLRNLGIDDPNDVDAIERQFGSIRKMRERGVDPSRIAELFDAPVEDPRGGNQDFDPKALKAEAVKEAIAEIRAETARGDHEKAERAAMDAIEKGIDQILGDGATAAEKKLWARAAKDVFWERTLQDKYPEDHPLAGYGRPAQSDVVIESLKAIKEEIAAERAAAIGDSANKPRRTTTPAGQTAQTRPSKGDDRVPPSQEDKIRRMEAIRAKHEGGARPISQAG